MNFIIYSLFLFIMTSLIGCTTLRPNPPVLNTISSNKVIITGVKYPELNLRFLLSFRTLNKECRYRPFTITPLIDQLDHEVHLVPKGKEQFKVEFYLDKYISGKCRWTPDRLTFSTDENTKTDSYGRWTSFAKISHDGKQFKKTIKMEYLCKILNDTKLHYCYIKDRASVRHGWPIVSQNGANIELSFKFENKIKNN